MFLVVDKPKGISSFDVIRIMRKQLNIKKIGHSWTLDPMATGIMVLATDQDTKKLTGIIWSEKTYEATIDLSKESDTWDTEYREYFKEITCEKQPTEDAIRTSLQSLVPEYLLPLPPFSAKKNEGKRSYVAARKWEWEIREQVMHIHIMETMEYNFPEVKIRCTVWSWTYIRSIAYRLGKQQWCWGILTQLRRTSIGSFTDDSNKERKECRGEIRHQEAKIKYYIVE